MQHSIKSIKITIKIYLGINSNECTTFLTSVGKNTFIALDTVWMFISENVTLTGQALIAVPATEMTRMPVL
jgi:hypothetical protein